MILKDCYDIHLKPTSEKHFYRMDNEANNFSCKLPKLPVTVKSHTNIKQFYCYDIKSYMTKSHNSKIKI